MASIRQESTGTFHVTFRINGTRFKRSLQTKKQSRAEDRRDEVNETLRLIKNGRLCVPSGVCPGAFVMADGNAELLHLVDTKIDSGPKTIRQLFKKFFGALPEGSLENSTLTTMRVHQRHLEREIGANKSLSSLAHADLQFYVNQRSKQDSQFIQVKATDDKPAKRKKVTAATIRKEIVTLNSIWIWARDNDFVDRPLPKKGLKYKKARRNHRFKPGKRLSAKSNWMGSLIVRQMNYGTAYTSVASKFNRCSTRFRNDLATLSSTP